MKIKDGGSLVHVTANREDVALFKRTWPCSGLPDKKITFSFEKKSGDIVDVYPDSVDGPDAVALAEDCWRFYKSAV